MRVNHAAVCIGNKIYSFGGYCSTEEYKDWEPIPVHILDTETLRWSVVKKTSDLVPFQRYGHTTVAYGDKVRLNLLQSSNQLIISLKESAFNHFV